MKIIMRIWKLRKTKNLLHKLRPFKNYPLAWVFYKFYVSKNIYFFYFKNNISWLDNIIKYKITFCEHAWFEPSDSVNETQREMLSEI